MSEKYTDFNMLNEYNNVFNRLYHTEGNVELFNTKQPDGWDIIDNTLIIIENKKIANYKNKGKKQLFDYYDNIVNKEQFANTYLILGYGMNKTFKYIIYDKDKNDTKMSLKDLMNKLNYKITYDEKEIHKINQYMHNNIKLQKHQRLLFISSILLCVNIDKDLLNDYDETTNSYVIADKIVATISKYYNDSIFGDCFTFILSSISNKHLFNIFQMIKNDINIYGKDILNLFYKEFSLWDNDTENKLGIVLTPGHIVRLMNKELQLKETDKVLDFCTGTGSFLIETSKISKNLYGCENDNLRYTLAKINFILHNINYNNLSYSSCFNYQYQSNYFDKVIFNPPFSQNSFDEENVNNECNWKSYDMEMRFILYGVELLKVGGIGCCIVPRSNFNNTKTIMTKFKKELLKHCKILKVINCIKNPFYPIGTEPVIITFKKIKPNDTLECKDVEIYEYDDGYKILNNTRIKDKDESFNKQVRTLTPDNDWNFIKDVVIDDIKNILKKDILNNHLDKMKTLTDINVIDKHYNDMKKLLIDIDNMNYDGFIKIKIDDIAVKENICKGKKIFKINECKEGDYPLISSTMFNNGISKYIDNWNYDCKDNRIISVARNGSVGYSFIQTGKIGITTDIILLKIVNKDIDINILSVLLSHYLSLTYSYGNKLTIDKLLNTEINYPNFI